MTGARMISDERKRQKQQEGYSSSHDDKHTECEMLHAATKYMEVAEFIVRYRRTDGAIYWGGHPPWHGIGRWPKDWDWKPDYADPIRNLVKAGALIAAEIDRVQAARKKCGRGQ